METLYPDDADGDALRRVEAGGADMTRPMRIEFTIEVSDLALAKSIAELVSSHGYEPDIIVSDEDGSLSVCCAKMMLATYDGVVSGQAELTRLCKPFGVICDSWGTFGNGGNQ